MAEIKLTKNELRAQQKRLAQLEKYLPTLRLKKAMLQAEVQEARLEIIQREKEYQLIFDKVDKNSALLTAKTQIDPKDVATVKEIQKEYENIAGVEIPHFRGIVFEEFTYNLFDSPPWIDSVIAGLRMLQETHGQVLVAQEKKEALTRELRNVTIRVNLFEKVLIPRAIKNIKKIKVFLGDQELAAVSQAKVAKHKIEMHRKKVGV